ncbi:neuropeptide SIFamide receptor-like [Bradysia coprophila]|uniref:neuropeptide SIFamide receptor-like n=1 Tax=Bradysia coprophila TaxID=38358 RepID=UPI00187DB7DC|nr:neuropeptide SIFamide receptor-like [Bradysia coprophila]
MLLRHLSAMKCELTWPSDSLKLAYYGFDGCENCVIPVCVVLYCYIVIWRKVDQRHIPGEEIGSKRLRQRREKDAIKVTKIILAITTYFVLSGVPLYVAFFVCEFNKDERNQEQNLTIHFWLDWLALTHLFVNPFLYCMLSTHMRKSFKKLIKCKVGTVAKNENVSLSTTTSRTTITNSIKLTTNDDDELRS